MGAGDRPRAPRKNNRIFAEYDRPVHRGGRTEAGHRLMLVAEYASRHPWIRFDHDIADGGE
jgi:hypothetical protein